MSEWLYDELGEGKIDKRKLYQIPIYQSLHGSIVTLQQRFPLKIDEWNTITKIINALEGSNHEQR